MNIVIFLSLTLLASAAFGLSAQAPVYITAGQSNAEGRASVSELPDYLRKGLGKGVKYASVREAQTGRFGRWKPGDTFSFSDVTNYLLDAATKEDVYSIKCTYGGTSITPGQYNENEAAWKPVWLADSAWLAANRAHSNTGGGLSLTLSLTDGLEKCVEETLGKLRQGYDVKVIMWHQGESDRKRPDDYYANFKEMITAMRERIAAVTGDTADLRLPFIFGTVPHASRQYSPTVEAAQLRVAGELPEVYALDFSNMPLGDDSLHFNGRGTERAGRMMYNKLVELGLAPEGASPVDVTPATDPARIAEALTIVSPAKSRSRCAVLICPGGGYEHLAMEHEGTDVAHWLADNGYTAAVLRYRFPEGNATVPTDDSRDAIRYLRSKADSLGIDPDSIGIMGFSAGGHLAASTSVLADPASRPAFQILMYPVISMEGDVTHWGSRNNLLGREPSELVVDRYSAERNVTPSTPEAIIILAGDDDVVNPDNSIRYYQALRRAGVPATMMIYPEGGHGWGMRDSFGYKKQWNAELLRWLEKL